MSGGLIEGYLSFRPQGEILFVAGIYVVCLADFSASGLEMTRQED